MTSTVCSSCGTDYASQPGTVFVVLTRRRGDFQACPRCHAEYLQICALNAKDEERVREEARARSKRAEERDQQRVEKQRQTDNKRTGVA